MLLFFHLFLIFLKLAQIASYPIGIVNYFSCDNVHLVHPKETCHYIANKYDIRLDFLKWKNKHAAHQCPDLLPGTKLCVDKWL